MCVYNRLTTFCLNGSLSAMLYYFLSLNQLFYIMYYFKAKSKGTNVIHNLWRCSFTKTSPFTGNLAIVMQFISQSILQKLAKILETPRPKVKWSHSSFNLSFDLIGQYQNKRPWNKDHEQLHLITTVWVLQLHQQSSTWSFLWWL